MKDKLPCNPWLTIWVRPRETIRAIVNFNPKYLFFVLSWIYGFPILLQFFQNISLGQSISLGWLLTAGIVLSPFIGMLGIVVVSALLFWTGRWIGGKGSFYGVRAAVTWSNVPSVISAMIWLIFIAVFQSRLFIQPFATDFLVGFEMALLFFSQLMQLVLTVWGIVIWLKTVSEVQKFSIWKAVLNILLACSLLAAAWFLLNAYYMFVG